MTEVTFSFQRLELAPGDVFLTPASLAAVFCHDGALTVDGAPVEPAAVVTKGATLSPVAGPATALLYMLDAQPHGSEAETLTQPLPFLLRVDEVVFPAGAVAYRHVHPGPGFRHLRRGRLHLQADDHAFSAEPGTTWFEPANAPVQATAAETMAETSFARCLLLPLAYEGQPSIQILDPDDAAKPKRQVTHRHLEQIVTDWP